MRQTIIVSALTALVTVVLSVVVLNQLGAGPVSSASVPDISASSNPASEAGQIQGDTDCSGNVEALDALGVLINVAALEALAQQEPCTNVGNLIPLGDGIPGPEGPQGEQGPPGSAGLSEIEIVSKSSLFNTAAIKDVEASCPAGKKVLGGGEEITSFVPNLRVIASLPQADGGGWSALGVEVLSTNANWELEVWAICANVAE